MLESADRIRGPGSGPDWVRIGSGSGPDAGHTWLQSGGSHRSLPVGLPGTSRGAKYIIQPRFVRDKRGVLGLAGTRKSCSDRPLQTDTIPHPPPAQIFPRRAQHPANAARTHHFYLGNYPFPSRHHHLLDQVLSVQGRCERGLTYN